jgi:Holliday junction resolvase
MRKRGRVDNNQADIVRWLRKAGCTVAITSGMGDGFPDLVVGYRWRTRLIEIKSPGGKLTPAQVTFIHTWTGEAPAVVTTAEEALMHMGVIPQQ